MQIHSTSLCSAALAPRLHKEHKLQYVRGTHDATNSEQGLNFQARCSVAASQLRKVDQEELAVALPTLLPAEVSLAWNSPIFCPNCLRWCT